MGVKRLIVIIGILNCQFLCAQDLVFSKRIAILDSSKGGELMKQCSRCVPSGLTNFWNISESDKVNLETNFIRILRLKSLPCSITYPNDTLSTLEYYLFQFIGVYIDNRKFIYINAFIGRQMTDRYRIEPVRYCDGGKAFWGALFDVENSEFSQLAFNAAG